MNDCSSERTRSTHGFCVLILLLAGAVPLALPGPAAACVLGLAGENFDLSTAPTIQRLAPAPAYNARNDEYMVIWFDLRNPGNNDLFGQRVDADGTLLGVNFPVVEASESQTDPWLVYNPNQGEYLAAWRTQEYDYFNRGQACRLAVDGTPIGPRFDVGNGFEISIVHNVVENQFLLTGRYPGEIGGQRVSHVGTLVGPYILLDSGDAHGPNGQVAYDPARNRYLATWRANDTSQLTGQIVGADGSPIGAPIQISTLEPGMDRAASVAYDPQNDRYLAVFQAVQGAEIHGRFVSGEGIPIGSTFLIASNLTDSISPFVVYDAPVACFVVCWKDGNSIFAQGLTLAGILVGGPLLVALRTAGMDPTAAVNTSTGEILIVWPDDRNFPQGEKDIYGQIVTCADVGDVYEAAGSPGLHDAGRIRIEPNPTADQATFSITLAGPAPTTLDLLSADGRVVRTLDAGVLPAGTTVVIWDGKGEDGHRLAGGAYFVRLRHSDEAGPRASKLLLVR